MNKLQLFTLCAATLSVAAIPTTPGLIKEPSITSINLDLGEIYNLEVSGGYQIVIKNGAPNIKISGHKQAIDRLNMIEKDDKLTIRPHKKISTWFGKLFNWSNTDSVDYQLKITLTMPLIFQLDLYGNSSVTVTQNVGIQESNLYGASTLSVSFPQTGVDPHYVLRGSSKLIATDLSSQSFRLNMKNNSSAQIGSISTTQGTRIETNDESRLSVKKIKSSSFNLLSYGKSRSSIDQVDCKLAEFSLYGSASQFIRNFNSEQLITEASGSSTLTIESGSALFARSQQRRNGKLNFMDSFKITELERQ